VIAVVAGRAARKRGEQMPDWGKTIQGLAIALSLFVAFINMAWGGN
jgi:hypothetical protein